MEGANIQTISFGKNNWHKWLYIWETREPNCICLKLIKTSPSSMNCSSVVQRHFPKGFFGYDFLALVIWSENSVFNILGFPCCEPQCWEYSCRGHMLIICCFYLLLTNYLHLVVYFASGLWIYSFTSYFIVFVAYFWKQLSLPLFFSFLFFTWQRVNSQWCMLRQSIP